MHWQVGISNSWSSIFPAIYSATASLNAIGSCWFYKGGVKGHGTLTAGGVGDGTLRDINV